MSVADTGPFIAFARLGRLDLLHQVVEALVIPDAVYEKLVDRGHDRPGAALLPDFGSGKSRISPMRQWQITTRRPVWLTQPYMVVRIKLRNSFNLHLFIVECYNQPWMEGLF
jgi:hypothetical protein